MEFAEGGAAVSGGACGRANSGGGGGHLRGDTSDRRRMPVTGPQLHRLVVSHPVQGRACRI
jgi:hypothetical protein